jgi:hypothetical protein
MFHQFYPKILISFFIVLTVFGFHKAASAQICQPATSDLVSWYRAESDATDAQGTNNGVARNGTTFAPGKVGRAFKFDGADDFVEIPDAPSLKPPQLTLEAWVRFDSLSSPGIGNAPPGFQYIIFKKNARQQDLFEGYSLIKLPGNRLAYSSSSNGGVQTTVVDNTQTVEAGKYYHVVGTYDGATARLYVNGRKVGEAAHNLPLDLSTRPVVVGGTNETNWDGRMNGLIDEVRIYNRALPDSEIQTNYLKDACRAAAEVPANLAAWYGGDGDARDFTGVHNGGHFFNVGYVVGRVGQAFRFENGSHVEINSDGIFRGQSEGTVEAWIRPRALPNGEFRHGAIWVESEASRNFTRLGLYYSDEGLVGVYANVSTVNAVSPVPLPLGEWAHVAGTYRAGEGSKIYVNGVLMATSANSGGALSNDPGAFLGIGALRSAAGDDFDFKGDIDEPSVYKRALSPNEIYSIYNAGTAGKARRVATPAGANVSVPVRDATVTFAEVLASGETAQTPLETAVLPALPAAYVHTGLAYYLATTAVFAGDANLCFNVPALLGANFQNLRLLQLENGNWIDRSTSVVAPQVCGRVSTLSPLVIAESLVPTAATVTVGGRVTSASGSGVYRARVTLTAPDGSTRTTQTNPFGYYRFAEVAAGATYLLSAASKQYVFTPETRIVNVTDELHDADFTARESFGR